MTGAEVRPSPSGKVLVRIDEGLMTITLNRPEVRNAIDRDLSYDVCAAVDEMDERDDLRVGILTGAGGTFCSGMDLKAFVRGEVTRVEGRGLMGIARTPPTKPMIAAVEGYAVAGGFEAALACDLLVAARDARFGLPEVRRGLAAAGGGLIRLPRLIPPRIGPALALPSRRICRARLAGQGNRHLHRRRRGQRDGAVPAADRRSALGDAGGVRGRGRLEKIATIAIARKLLTRAYHLLADMQATDTTTPLRRP